jgi:superfamily II DNA/RNA helicase
VIGPLVSSFSSLGVPARLSDVLASRGITTPTPIQAATLPDSLAGRDVLGRGRTGSGKTLAFLLPIVARLTGSGRPTPGAPRALILAPTRELATQIDQALAPLADAAGLSSRTVFGGVGQKPQVNAIRRGVDVVIACPGRLEDLIAQGHCSLRRVEITVLDEADHMSDLGFLPSVRRLLSATPEDSQRMLFSATLDKAVDALVWQFLSRPAVHHADSERSPVSSMSHHVLRLERELRLPVLLDLTSAPGRTLVFTRTKHGAKALTRQLNAGGVAAVELHGNLNQNARVRNMDAFHSGWVETLVATDIAARGIHVDDIALVIHADPPTDHKAYLHRSGRTARAGNQGTVVTLMTRAQAGEVRALARAAGVSPITTTIASVNEPMLSTLAPGPRVIATRPPTRPDRRRPGQRATATAPSPVTVMGGRVTVPAAGAVQPARPPGRVHRPRRAPRPRRASTAAARTRPAAAAARTARHATAPIASTARPTSAPASGSNSANARTAPTDARQPSLCAAKTVGR